MHLLYFLLIGLLAGWIAVQVMKGSSFGLLGNLLIGIVGAVLGGFLFGLLGLTTSSLLGELIAATVGAILLLYVIRLAKK